MRASLVVSDYVVIDQPVVYDRIEVAPSGHLEINEGARITTGEIVVHGTFEVNGTPKTPYARLLASGRAGDRDIAIQVPHDWQVGDALGIADTRLIDYTDRTQWEHVENINGQLVKRPTGGWHHETAVITDMDDGSITLDWALRFDHLGDSHGNLPHLANLSRSIEFHALENQRAHLIAHAGSSVNIVGAEFNGFGRTTTAYIGDDNPTGQYAIHLHRAGTDHEIASSAIKGSPRWGIVAHDTSDVVIRDNAIWQAEGAGIVVEQGDEQRVRINGNYVGAATGDGKPIDSRKRIKDDSGSQTDIAFEGAGIWLRGIDGATVTDNVAEGNGAAQFTVFQFDLPRHLRHIQKTAVPETFAGNIAAGGRTGFELWNTRADGVHFSELTSWNAPIGFGMFYVQKPIVISESSFYGQPVPDSIGIAHMGGKHSGDWNLTNVTVIGFNIGAILRPRGAPDRVESSVHCSLFANTLDFKILSGRDKHDTTLRIDITSYRSREMITEPINQGKNHLVLIDGVEIPFP